MSKVTVKPSPKKKPLKADKDLSKHVDTALKKLSEFVSKPLKKGAQGTGADNARYGSVSTSGVLRFNEWPCHSRMSTYPSPAVVFSQFGHRPDLADEARKAYFDWIVSDTGPWRAFQGRNISHTQDSLTEMVPDLDWIYDNGFVWSDLSWPSNLQHNFLVASRMAAEWPYQIEKWYDWIQKGIHPGLAFLYLDVFRPLGYNEYTDKHFTGKDWLINHTNKYDWPCDVTTASEEYVKSFCSGRVDEKVLNQPYSKSQQYTPVNRIFGKNDYNTKDKSCYPNRVIQIYSIPEDTERCKAYWDKKGTGFSSFDIVNHFFIPEDRLLSVMTQEQERLKL